jgi:hypothetical protein
MFFPCFSEADRRSKIKESSMHHNMLPGPINAPSTQKSFTSPAPISRNRKKEVSAALIKYISGHLK